MSRVQDDPCMKSESCGASSMNRICELKRLLLSVASPQRAFRLPRSYNKWYDLRIVLPRNNNFIVYVGS